LHRDSILTKFADEGPLFSHPAVRGGSQPLRQFLPASVSQHLQELLQESLGALDMRMELGELSQGCPFFFRSVVTAPEHQADGPPRGHFNGRRRRFHWEPLLLHRAKRMQEAFYRHAEPVNPRAASSRKSRTPLRSPSFQRAHR